MNNEQHPASGSLPAWAAWGMSALNGLFGDYLHGSENGLTIDMAFYHQNRSLPLVRERLQHALPHLAARICVLVHGLGCNEDVWTFPDPLSPERVTSYGALLQAERGYTPFYVRYNTGLSIADNGKRLAALLDDLLASYPIRVDEIVLIGHSMGGLVIRSACLAGAQRQSDWVQRVTRAFYLGTPHDGANLERLTHTAATVLQTVPNPITRLIGQILNLRSQGVKDLRFGAPLEPDAIDTAPAGTAQPQRPGAPWPAHVQHYLIGGMLTDDPEHPVTMLFGDGLVGVPGASERAPAASAGFAIPEDHVRLFPRTHHLKLAHDWEVYQQISAWCAST